MSPKEPDQGHRRHLRTALSQSVARLWPSRRSKSARNSLNDSTSWTSSSSDLASPSSFIHFPKLPLELRNQIWRHALPDVGPFLCPYSKDFWRRRLLSVTDEEYDENIEDPDHNWLHEFRHDLIPASLLDVSLAFVNREAFRIARGWIRYHGIRYDSRVSSFVSPFDPSRDAIYVPTDRFKEFLTSSNHLGQTGSFVRTRCDIQNIAISEETLRVQWENIPTAFFLYRTSIFLHDNSIPNHNETLLVILDAPRGLGRMKGPEDRWQCRTVGGAFVWDDHEKAMVLKNGGWDNRQEQFGRIEETINRFHFYGVSEPPYLAEVRPVVVVRD